MLFNRRIVVVVAATAVVSCTSGSQETNQYLEIGHPCDILTDAGPRSAVYNPQALECPSRICLKPIVQQGATAGGVTDPSGDYTVLPTGPYCSAMCAKDSDCEGQQRDSQSSTDRRCKTGYACGVIFEVGPFCCKKLCLCKDFYSGSLLTPVSCESPTACSA